MISDVWRRWDGRFFSTDCHNPLWKCDPMTPMVRVSRRSFWARPRRTFWRLKSKTSQIEFSPFSKVVVSVQGLHRVAHRKNKRKIIISYNHWFPVHLANQPMFFSGVLPPFAPSIQGTPILNGKTMEHILATRLTHWPMWFTFGYISCYGRFLYSQ